MGRDGVPRHFSPRGHHFPYRETCPVTQVVYATAFVQCLQGQDVCLSQVHYVDVIPDTSSVSRRIVVTVDIQTLSLPQGNLHQQGDQMGFRIVVLAVPLGGARGVEVAQAGILQPIPDLAPVQYPLDHQF